MKKKIIDTTLSPRQTSILFALVKEYCDTSTMIGSKELQEKYNFKFSSATIRNEMSELREKGYVFQPFTNSASKPTEQAFKLFVTQILNGLQVTTKKQKELEKQLEQMQVQHNKLSKEISKLLALNSGSIGFAVTKNDEAYSGTKNLYMDSDSTESSKEGLSHVLDFLDNLDENKKFLLDRKSIIQTPGSPKPNELIAYFNGDDPVLSLGGGYAMVATEITLDNGEKSVVGLISKVHMLTKKNSLETVKAINNALNKNK
jgi:Winged helix-turn-helix transcription repressor, HrcA DNA-binding